MKKSIFAIALSLAMALPLAGQSSNPAQNPNDAAAPGPPARGGVSRDGVGEPQNPNSSSTQYTDDQNNAASDQQQEQFNYRVSVTQRSTQAVDYRDRGGTTQVDFKGTSLMPTIEGRARVTGHTGRLAIDASFHHLKPTTSFGPEYLTYVLWAITPEGRPTNLGEVIPNDDGDAYLQLTSGLQEFGLILTAEPYFAVSRPSDLLVAENIIKPETEGGVHPITARYELLQKGQYTINVSPAQLPATEAEHRKKTPLTILEAENAIAIAEASGASQYAGATLQKAQDYLSQAQEYQRHKQGKTPIGTVARAAVESAEDARLITMEKKQQELAAAQRRRQQERIQRAQSEAERESVRAEEARSQAQREADQRALAEQERSAAEQARAQAEQARLEAQRETAEAQAQAQQQAQQAAQAQSQAQQQLAQAQQQQQALAQQAEQSRLQAQQAEQARMQAEQQAEQQRQRLLQQLNQVLQTKDTAKGLIVNVSDVLFDTGKSTLKPGAKVRLAKVAGIILAYPDLRLEVDGYTDSTGSAEFNQRLSEKRADAVHDFLVSQGVSANNVGARGFGKEDPIASNSTAAGRQLNRRVELVVSGSAIGQNVGSTTGAPSSSGVGGIAGSSGASTTAPSAYTTPSSTTGSPGAASSTTPAASTPSPGTPSSSTPSSNTPSSSTPGSISTPAGSSGTTMTPSSTTTTPSSTGTPPPATPQSTGRPPM